MHARLPKVWVQRQGTKRLFLAIPISSDWADVFEACEASILRVVPEIHPPIHWTKRNNFHITVRFIGNVAESCIPKLIVRIRAVLGRESAFTIPFDRLGIETPNEPKMIWAKFRATQEFIGLVGRVTSSVTSFLENECGGLQLQNGHTVIPHVTLARCKGPIPAIPLPNLQDMALHDLNVTTIVLHSSTTLTGGSVYTPLATFTL